MFEWKTIKEKCYNKMNSFWKSMFHNQTNKKIRIFIVVPIFEVISIFTSSICFSIHQDLFSDINSHVVFVYPFCLTVCFWMWRCVFCIWRISEY